MSKSLSRVRGHIEALGLETEIIEMPSSTRSAAEAASSVGCELDQIVKSILFLGMETNRLVLFLTAGGNRIDPDAAGQCAGQSLGRADADRIRQETGFAIGGVSPFGHLAPIQSFLDPRLMEFDLVWAAAGTPRHVFSLRPQDLLQATGADLADFTD